MAAGKVLNFRHVLAFLVTGYAVESASAGEPVESPLWLVPAFAGYLVTLLALSANGDES